MKLDLKLAAGGDCMAQIAQMTAAQQTRIGGGAAQEGMAATLVVMVCLLFVPTVHAEKQTFVNPSPISIQDHTNASPYPSSIFVSGFTEVVDKITVTLQNLTHPRPEDLDLLLVGPGGQNVLLLSDAGAASTNETPGVTNVTLTFDDLSPVQLRQVGLVSSGTYRPTDYAPIDQFPSNAPAGPYETNLDVFRETNPNGAWQLFVVDDQEVSGGSIGSWSLTISAHSRIFTNTSPIIISNTATNGSPYPVVIGVTNVTGTITKVTATLFGLTHSYASDLDVLLVGPNGDSVVLMSDAGGGIGVTKVTLTFDNAAIASLPASTALQSGSFKPTDLPGSDTFAAPAPAGPYGTNLAVFNGQSANGTWRLFVADDFPAADGGQIAGWTLSISTEPLAITHQPESLSVLPGSNAVFYVSVAGVDPITYQWRLNGFKIAGATNSALRIPAVNITNAGTYSVAAANPYGVVQSEKVMLLPAFPLNSAADNVAESVVFTATSGTLLGTNYFATKEPSEPKHAGKPGGSSVWYAWTPNAGGIATFDTRGSTFDTLLGVYTGSTLSNLTLVARDDDGGGFYTSRASFNVAANQTYRIAVDGLAGSQGTLVLNWGMEPTVNLLPDFSHPPLGQTVAAGDEAVLNVGATGPGLSYQWTLNGTAIAGATSNTLVVTNVQAANVGTYQLAATTAAGRTAFSEPMVLEIGPNPAVQSRAKHEDVLFIGEAFPSIVVSSSSLVTTDAFQTVMAGTVSGRQVLNNFGGGSTAESSCGYIDLTHAKYLGLIPADNGEFVIHTTGSQIPTRMEIYQVLDDTGILDCVSSVEGDPSVTRFVAASNGQYVVAVDALDHGVTGVIQINWSFGAFLSIRLLNSANAVLSWVAGSNAYQLESTPALSPAIWSAFTPSPPVVFTNGTNVAIVPVFNPLSPPTNRFFRLMKPPPPAP